LGDYWYATVLEAHSLDHAVIEHEVAETARRSQVRRQPATDRQLVALGHDLVMTIEEPPRFEPFAADYEDHASTSAYNALYDRPAVLELCGAVTGLRVLDAGCGPGLYAEELVARGAHDVVGLDASPAMIELARLRVPERASFRAHDLQAPLDWLEPESFDLAVMALVIHHLDDRVAALRELHRVLRPDGHLVVSTHHPTGDWLRHGGSYFDVSVIEETWNRGWRVRYWRQPLTQTVTEFNDAGFLIERVVEPLPASEMATRYPDDYELLRTSPGFIAFRLLKAPEERRVAAGR
jgi:SAM-dependent methyltransferase